MTANFMIFNSYSISNEVNGQRSDASIWREAIKHKGGEAYVLSGNDCEISIRISKHCVLLMAFTYVAIMSRGNMLA